MTDALVERVARALYDHCHEAEHGEVYENETPEGREYWNGFARVAIKAQASRIAELEGEIVLGSERMADLCIIVPPKHASAVARWADELRKALEDKTLSNGGGE